MVVKRRSIRSKRVSRRRVSRRTRGSSRRRVSKRQRSSRRTRRRMKGGGLHDELKRLKLTALQKRAASAGIADEDLEAATEADDPKAALIALLLAVPPVRQVHPVQYKAVTKGVIRESVERNSDNVGNLPVGTVIDVLSTEVLHDGTTRVQFNGGWVSVKAGSGKVLLEPLTPIIDFKIVVDFADPDADRGLALEIKHPSRPNFPSKQLANPLDYGITEEDMVKDLKEMLEYAETDNISNIKYYSSLGEQIQLEDVLKLQKGIKGKLTFHLN